MAELEDGFFSDNDIDDYLLSLAELGDDVYPLQATMEETVENADRRTAEGYMNIKGALDFTNVCQSSETYHAHKGHVTERFEPLEDIEYPFDGNSQELVVGDDWQPSEKENCNLSKGGGDIESDSIDITVDAFPMGTSLFINTQADAHLGVTLPRKQEAAKTYDSSDGPLQPLLLRVEVGTAKTQHPAIEMEPPRRTLTKSRFLALGTSLKCQNLTLDSIQFTSGNTQQSLANATGMKLFVRGQFPTEVQPRSVIDCLSTRTVVKTCFRLGEAISVGVACKNMPYDSEAGDVLVELYGCPSY